MRFNLGCCVANVCKKRCDLTFVGADVGEGLLDCVVVALTFLFAFIDLMGDFIESLTDFAHFESLSFAGGGFFISHFDFSDNGFDLLGGGGGGVLVVIVVVVVVDDFATLGRRECCLVLFHGVVEEFVAVDIPDAAVALGGGGGGGCFCC